MTDDAPARLFPRRPLLVLGAALALLLPACGDDGVSPDPVVRTEVGAVVNSVEITLTVLPVEDPDASAVVELGPDGTPSGLAVRGGRALVPMGTVPALAVVDLAEGVREATVPLPEGSGATGSAFLNDTLALAANPGRNTVSVVNLSSLSAGAEIETGGFPQEVLVRDGRVFVLNSELGADFAPARSGTITVLDASDLSPVGTVELSGDNPGGGAFGPDGRLYVVLSGTFGGGNGSVSVVDPEALAEVAHHEGFGDFPGNIAVGPDGTVYVSSWSYGIAVWDPGTGTFIRSPDDPVAPGATPSTAGMAFDSAGRFYALHPLDCQQAGSVSRLDPTAFAVEVEIRVGVCPVELAFTEVREPEE